MAVAVEQHLDGPGFSRARCGPPAIPARRNPRTARTRRRRLRARRCASPRSSAGASSRTADRQLGSRNTIGSPREAASNSASALACAAARASSSRPLRDQRPAAAAVRRERARRRRRPRARRPRRCPISGWLWFVKVSVNRHCRLRIADLRIAGARTGCANVSRANVGSVRRRSMPSSCSLIHRPTPLPATRFDSGAKRLPDFGERVRVADDARFSGMPWRCQ